MNEPPSVTDVGILEPVGGAWVFSAFSYLGPEPIVYSVTPDDDTINKPSDGRLNQRSLLQVAIKSISLLLGDFAFEHAEEEILRDTHLFGVLPYPDFQSVAFTYFTYYKQFKSQRYIPVSFSLIVHESKRSFIYENNKQLERVIQTFTDKILQKALENKITIERNCLPLKKLIEEESRTFSSEVQIIRSRPINPISQQRRLKILFTGLENTGKTSFLCALNRKFSEIVSLPPSQRPHNEPMHILGTNVIKWDLPGQDNLRKKILEKSELYLYETDILYYCIDVREPRIEESKQYLTEIITRLKEYALTIPILILITKMDEDIAQKVETRDSVQKIKTHFEPMLHEYPHYFFETSIFKHYSILNAFSCGIRQLSPNRRIMEHILYDFMHKTDQLLALLLNEEGLVLANQEKTDPKYEKKLSRNQIFELTAPNFTAVAQQFAHYFPKDSNVTQYNLSEEDIVVLIRFFVEETPFFLLFYSKNPASRAFIDKEIKNLEEKISNLLTYYMN
jgi:GTPase SAR1 family protein